MWFNKPSARVASGTSTQNGVILVSVVMLALVAILSAVLVVTSKQVSVGLTTFLVFLAAAAFGALAGFIFGLPRSRFADRNDAGTGPNTTAPGVSAYLANSNLIKVSDWLTTIITGLALVNLGSIVPAMQRFASALKEPLGGASYSGAVGLAVAILGCISAALMGYMWTSMRGRELWEDLEAKYRGGIAPDLKGLTVAEARKVVEPLPVALDVVGLLDTESIDVQKPDPGVAPPDGRIQVTKA